MDFYHKELLTQWDACIVGQGGNFVDIYKAARPKKPLPSANLVQASFFERCNKVWTKMYAYSLFRRGEREKEGEKNKKRKRQGEKKKEERLTI
jgi:hypothetical protein